MIPYGTLDKAVEILSHKYAIILVPTVLVEGSLRHFWNINGLIMGTLLIYHMLELSTLDLFLLSLLKRLLAIEVNIASMILSFCD